MTSAPSRRRRLTLVLVLLAAAACLLASAELVARSVLDDRLAEATPGGLAITSAGFATWGLATGEVQVTITIDETALAGMVDDRAEQLRMDDAIIVTTTRTTGTGNTVPVEVTLMPEVSGGALTVEVVGASLNGMSIPPALVGDAFDFSPSGLSPTSTCAGALAVDTATVDGDVLLLGGTLDLDAATC